MPRATTKGTSFVKEAERILNLPIEARINKLGGYGPNGEAIYEAHPFGCPSVVVDNIRDATATFMSNGSTAFAVKLAEGMEVNVLDGSYDYVEKRETCVPSTNLWLDVSSGKERWIASLINPRGGAGCKPTSIRIVKMGDPDRCMWYCADYAPTRNVSWRTAVKHSLCYTKSGPALLRQVFIQNTGRRALKGKLWSYYMLHGTQRFVYNKESWYDRGLPLSNRETVVSATVPYSEIVQIKRLSSLPRGMRPAEATCDYATFVGDSAAHSTLPEAVQLGEMLSGSAGRRMNRFSTATMAANRFDLELAPKRSALLEQSLLYVTDDRAVQRFRRISDTPAPDFRGMSAAFKKAVSALVKSTVDAREAVKARRIEPGKEPWPVFEFTVRDDKAVSEYIKSVWTGVDELYENCRAHGAKLAEGIELGTRDRGQDMWPKLKEDPERVRADLLHAFSFMYVTQKSPVRFSKPLTLEQKLHGMFPRQYPSRWDNRNSEVLNDNRPYADSPLWLINSLHMLIRETGDASILRERVKTVRLLDPKTPERSGVIGCSDEYRVVEVLLEILACFERLANDGPYGMAQIMYGDWCDPVDMYGTSIVGDAGTRGKGRGVQTRLSQHLFECLVETVDTLEAPGVTEGLKGIEVGSRIKGLKKFANRLRENIIKWAWEDGQQAGFVDVIHELKANGKRPNYKRGETGYTLGSMRGRDFDGIKRRVLISQAYGLQMLLTERPWLKKPARQAEMVRALLKTTDSLFHDKELGLVLFSAPVSNNANAVRLVGRMGVVPAGCAENGEYHHAQVMMHRNRLAIASEAEEVWQQFPMVMSAMRDESICGPFDMPTNSCVADRTDPHFGKGMYFGLSGSVDWIVGILERTAGLELALHDDRKPDLQVDPRMPTSLGSEIRYRRVVHHSPRVGVWKEVPVEVIIRRSGKGSKVVKQSAIINGKPVPAPEIEDIRKLKKACIEVDLVYGK